MISGLPVFARDERYYDYVARGYDRIAESYDEIEAKNIVGRRLRAHMQFALFRTFQPGNRVLEIGCGTGIDAIALAERGVTVLATDISKDMVARVRRKAAANGLVNLEARCLAANKIGDLEDELGRGHFDGAYSSGGALNMDPCLEDFSRGLSRLLRRSGRFLCSVVNQASLFETLFYPAVLRPRKAFRRLGNVIPIPITRLEAHRHYVVPAKFYSPRTFVKYFRGSFELRHLQGLQIFLPPWNLSDYVDRFAGLARAVEALEDRIANRPPFNSWGSLYLLELERVE